MVVPHSVSPLDLLLPKYNFTGNITITNEKTTLIINDTQPSSSDDNINQPIIPENIKSPFIPRFIVIWGYIGAAAYVLKVTTIKVQKGQFKNIYIPYHIASLFIGTAVAVVVFFILSTGGFFGLTIDFTKISNPNLVQFAYAAVAFFSGYSVRHVISVISGIIDNVFLHGRRGKSEQEHMRDQGE